MPIRVLRLIEYVYPDGETMAEDMAAWQVQGTMLPGRGKTIRSTVLPAEFCAAMPPARYFEAIRVDHPIEYSLGPQMEQMAGEIEFIPGNLIDLERK